MTYGKMTTRKRLSSKIYYLKVCISHVSMEKNDCLLALPNLAFKNMGKIQR